MPPQHVHKLTRQECDKLAAEMQDIVMRIFAKDFTIKRVHTEKEQQRLEEIAEILKNCEVVD
jgi:hypothetical protein